jgi:hypothetical protein
MGIIADTAIDEMSYDAPAWDLICRCHGDCGIPEGWPRAGSHTGRGMIRQCWTVVSA